MTTFNELLKRRRSIRDFEDKPVDTGIIRELIQESCLAPSAGNGQPWKFIIINDMALIKTLSDESKKNILAFIEANPDTPSKKYEAAMRDPGFNVFYNAPSLLYIVGHKEARNLAVDCTLAAGYFMMAAAARNLGTCWVGLGTSIMDPDLLEHIGMPADHKIVAPIILGYPKQIPEIPPRMAPSILKELP